MTSTFSGRTSLRLAPILTAMALALLAWIIAFGDLRLVVALLALGGGAALALRWPFLVWVAIGLFLPFAAAQKSGPVSLLDVLLAGAFALWFLDGVRRRSLRVLFTPAAVLAGGYVVTLLLASLGARDLGESLAEVIKWVQFAAILLIAPTVIARGQVRWVVAAVLVGAAAQAALGLYQFVFRIGPEWFIILGRFMRASGSFAQPNPFAGYLGVVLPVGVSLSIAAVFAVWDAPKSARNWAWLALVTAATALIAAGLLASWSRGAWFAAAAAGVAVVALRSRKAALTVLVAGAVVLVAILLGNVTPGAIPEPVMARVRDVPAFFGVGDMLNQEVNDDNFAIIERLAHWEAAKRMFDSAPLLGVGPGNYAANYADFRLLLWPEALGHAHNVYLNTLAESGVVGFDAFLLLWIVAALGCWRVVRKTLSPFTAALGIGVLGVLVHLAIHNLVDNLFVQGIYVQVALWLALVAARE